MFFLLTEKKIFLTIVCYVIIHNVVANAIAIYINSKHKGGDFHGSKEEGQEDNEEGG